VRSTSSPTRVGINADASGRRALGASERMIMARLPQTGRAFSSLYERTPEFDRMVEAGLVNAREAETTLREVIEGLGLKSLSGIEEETVRFELGLIIAAGQQRFADSPKHNAERVTVELVQKTLLRMAATLEAMPSDPKQLDDVERLLQGAEDGLRTTLEIAVATRVRARLARMIDDPEKASDVIREFRANPRPVADACRKAVADLGSIKTRSAAVPIDFSGFRRVVELIAMSNGISPTLVVNRHTHAVEGKFIEIAEGLERLFPRYLRSPTRNALAQRLRRASKS
jgi:hypothetical protein